MKLIESVAPHIRTKSTTQSTMLIVLISLLPCVISSVIFNGFIALLNMVVAIAAAMVAEALWQKLARQKVTVCDLSAAVTGLLLALCVPAIAPCWILALGSAFAIIVVKQFFGGLGDNFLNPALAGRAFLLASFPVLMTTYSFNDALTSATPLIMKSSLFDLFLGRTAGASGETSVIAILIGFVILVATGTIRFYIPVVTVAAAAVTGLFFGLNPLTVICSGGLMFGAVFMATDYVTSPMRTPAQIIYAAGIGILTVLIRECVSVFPEGVTYSILIMNICAPLLDKIVPEKVYGYNK